MNSRPSARSDSFLTFGPLGWHRWHLSRRRLLAQDRVGGKMVVTLRLEHAPPFVAETIIYGTKPLRWSHRSEGEALAAHRSLVRYLRSKRLLFWAVILSALSAAFTMAPVWAPPVLDWWRQWRW